MQIVCALTFAALAAYLWFPYERTMKVGSRFRHSRTKAPSDDQLLNFALAFRLELESGVLCEAALEQALLTLPIDAVPMTRHALANGAPIAQAMHHDAHNLTLLRDLSLAIALSKKQGSQLGHSLAVMTDSIQSRIQTNQLVRIELSSTRTTIAVLAALPLLGLVFATALGAHPLAWLLGSNLGRTCLTLAVMLEIGGLLWTKSLVKRAMRSRD
jgi:tight adherence protein B